MQPQVMFNLENLSCLIKIECNKIFSCASGYFTDWLHLQRKFGNFVYTQVNKISIIIYIRIKASQRR